MARVRLQGNEDLTTARLQGQIDWGTLGNEIIGNIENVRADREARINAISEATKKLADQADNNPIGRNTDINDFSYNLTDLIKKTSYLDYNMLKSGEISSNDYLKKVNGFSTQINNVYDTLTNWNTNMEDVLKRAEEGTSSAFELDLLDKITGIADFNKLTPIIVPSTGRLAFASEEGGVTHILDDRQMKLVAQFRKDKVDLNKTLLPKIEQSGIYVNQFLGPRGSVVEFLSQTGDDKTPEGKERRKKFDEYLDSIADEVLANPYTMASILMDVDGGYKVALDDVPEGESREKVLLTTIDPNGRVNIDTDSPEGKKQEERAREIIKNRLAVMMDEKRKTVSQPPRPTEGERKADAEGKSDQDVVSNVAKLYYGDEAEVTEAEDSLSALNPNISSVKRVPDGVTISFFDGRPPQYIPFTVGDELRSQSSWVIGATNFFLPDKQKISNVNTVLRNSGVDLNRGLSDVTVIRETSLPDDPVITFDRYFNNIDKENPSGKSLSEVFKMNEKNATIELNKILQGTPFIAERSTSLGTGGEIKIKDPEGKSVATFDSDINMTSDEIDSNIAKLKNILISLTPEDNKISFVQTMGTKAPNDNRGIGELD